MTNMEKAKRRFLRKYEVEMSQGDTTPRYYTNEEELEENKKKGG